MREIFIGHHLGPFEEMIPALYHPDGSVAESATDMHFREIAQQMIAEDELFTRAAWTTQLSSVLASDNEYWRESYANAISNALRTWSIAYEPGNVYTH